MFSTKVEYRIIDMDGEPMPAPVLELARIEAREERKREQAKACETRQKARDSARARRNMVKIDLGNGQILSVTRKRARQIEKARRDYAERERQKMRDLGIASEKDGPPWERERLVEKSGKRLKKGFYTFDYWDRLEGYEREATDHCAGPVETRRPVSKTPSPDVSRYRARATEYFTRAPRELPQDHAPRRGHTFGFDFCEQEDERRHRAVEFLTDDEIDVLDQYWRLRDG
jgi:hypothetical protein